MYEKAIRNASSDQRWDEVETGRSTDNFAAHFPEDIKEVTEQEYIRGYERYFKVMEDKFRVYEAFSGKEDLLDAGQFERYLMQPAWLINNEKGLKNEKPKDLTRPPFEKPKAEEEGLIVPTGKKGKEEGKEEVKPSWWNSQKSRLKKKTREESEKNKDLLK